MKPKVNKSTLTQLAILSQKQAFSVGPDAMEVIALISINYGS
jgi:hypothetical protein